METQLQGLDSEVRIVNVYWMIQVDQSTVDEIYEDVIHGENIAEHWLPADRKTMDPEQGDKVVLWVKGPGNVAGAVALGYARDVEDAYHLSTYKDEAEAQIVLRRSVDMVITHLFTNNPVRRVDLKNDPRFDGFMAFKPGGAQVANPWALEEEQYDAIVDRMPAPEDLEYPQGKADLQLSLAQYNVSVEYLFDADKTIEPLEQFKSMVTERDYDRMGMEIRSVGMLPEDPAEAILERLTLPETPHARLVIWETTVVAESAELAFLEAVSQMKMAVGSLKREDVQVIEFGHSESETDWSSLS